VLSFAAALAATLLGAAATTPFPTGADISVDLNMESTVLLNGAHVEVSITNHGPKPLASATVVVQFGANAAPTQPMPCAFDGAAETLTCSFGALPVGSTATIPTTVYFLISGRPIRFSNTATRTASTPSDPNSANDTDSEDCNYIGGGFPPPPIPTLYC
jgi:hypothetical protein